MVLFVFYLLIVMRMYVFFIRRLLIFINTDKTVLSSPVQLIKHFTKSKEQCFLDVGRIEIRVYTAQIKRYALLRTFFKKLGVQVLSPTICSCGRRKHYTSVRIGTTTGSRPTTFRKKPRNTERIRSCSRGKESRGSSSSKSSTKHFASSRT